MISTQDMVATTKALKQFEQLKGIRYNWETHWRDVAAYVWPESDKFWETWNTSSHGTKRNIHIYDSTAVNANSQCASLFESILTPRNQRWHELKSPYTRINQDKAVQEWCYQATSQLFKLRYEPAAGFSAQSFVFYMSLAAFGTACMFVDRDPETMGIRYKSEWIGDIYFDVNHQGDPNVVYRRFDFSHAQAIEKWGEKNVPRQIVELAQTNPHERHEYLHCVKPNEDKKKGEDFIGEYFSYTNNCKIGESETYYRTMPYVISRFKVSPFEIWGRSPAMDALPDIRTLNEVRRTQLRAADKSLDPPLLVANDAIMGSGQLAPDLRSGGLNYGGVSPDGRQLIQPLQSGVRLDWNQQIIDQLRLSVRESFMVNIFEILIELPRMTATQSIMRSQEKAALLAPMMARQQTEFLGKLIERELDIAQEIDAPNGEPAIPPPPKIMMNEWEVSYESPLARMQKAESLTGIQQTLDALIALGGVDPSVADVLDAEKALTLYAERTNAPPEIIRSTTEVQAIRQRRAEQEQAIAMAQAAPQLASASKDLAQAEQIRQGG